MRIIKKILNIIFLLFFILTTSKNIVCAINKEEITAKSAVLIDVGSKKILFEKNSHEKRPCASLTKLMVLLLAMEAIDDEKISTNESVTAGKSVSSKNGSHIWIKPDEQLTIEELIKSVAVASANDASVVLAEKIAGSENDFIKQMIAKADKIGMKNTVFKNAIGEEEKGQVSTAHDLALLSIELMKFPEILDYTSTWIDTIRGGKTQIVNTNKMLKSYDGTNGLKTGTTDEAGSCAAISASRDNLNLISITLASDNGTLRFEDATKLLNFGFANFSSIDPQTPDDLIFVKVMGGTSDIVSGKIEECRDILIPKGKEKAIEYKIFTKDNIKAPVAIGTNLGTITYKLENDVLAEYPIVAVKEIPEVNFVSSFSVLFKNFLSM